MDCVIKNPVAMDSSQSETPRKPAFTIGRFSALSARARAVCWMLVASLLVTAIAALVKYLGQTLPVTQMAAIRALFLLMAILPFMARQGRHVFQLGNPVLLIARALTMVAVNVAAFWVLTRLPLVFVTSITFSKPLFIAILAALFLGETLRLRRSLATTVGFIGVLIMLNPTTVTLADGQLSAAIGAVGVAFGMAIGVILVKKLSDSEDPNTIIFYGNLGVFGVLIIPSLWFWVSPDPVEWLCLAALGVLGLAAQSCFIRAYLAADATFVAPFEYSRILAAALAGHLFFAETPDIWTAIGATLIVGSTLYMARREAHIRRTESDALSDTSLPPPPSL